VTLSVQFDHEDDGRWIAIVPELPGVLCYGGTRDEALRAAQALALRVIADRIEHGEASPDDASVTFNAAAAA
jgi:predicted RNase H-like HicB family nuclease